MDRRGSGRAPQESTQKGVVIEMSVLIGICGEEYCLLFGDTRRVRYEGGQVRVTDDQSQNIFRVNDRVLFGMTGLLAGTEALFAPLRGFRDKEAITLRLAVRAAGDYLRRSMGSLPGPTCCVAVGSDNKGRFRACEIAGDPATGQVETAERSPEPPGSPWGITCILPPGLAGERERCLEQIKACAARAGSPEELAEQVCSLIRNMAKRDPAVGKAINVYMISK